MNVRNPLSAATICCGFVLQADSWRSETVCHQTDWEFHTKSDDDTDERSTNTKLCEGGNHVHM